MSLECAVEIDALNSALKQVGKQTPVDLFNANLYRQPALAAEYLVPEKYRNKTSPEENSPSPLARAAQSNKSRLPSVEGVTMVSTMNHIHTGNSPQEHSPSYDATRRSSKRPSPYPILPFSITSAASVDEDREIGTAMETIDEENVEDQIDELLASQTSGSKSFSERASLFKASSTPPSCLTHRCRSSRKPKIQIMEQYHLVEIVISIQKNK
jgi:hypothetical protein